MRRLFRFRMAVLWVVLCGMAGCATVTSIDQFRAQWASGQEESAVSWWYLSENAQAYLLLQRTPLSATSYQISKQHIRIVGVPPRDSENSHEPLNLKSEQLQWIATQ